MVFEPFVAEGSRKFRRPIPFVKRSIAPSNQLLGIDTRVECRAFEASLASGDYALHQAANRWLTLNLRQSRQ
jgi:hypothetical protein